MASAEKAVLHRQLSFLFLPASVTVGLQLISHIYIDTKETTQERVKGQKLEDAMVKDSVSERDRDVPLEPLMVCICVLISPGLTMGSI